MRQLCAGNPVTIEAAHALLCEQDIEVRLFDEATARAQGGFSFRRPVSELWIVNDEDLPRAAALVAEFLAGRRQATEKRAPWKCPACGQIIGAQFTECWNCALDPDEDDPRRNPEAKCDECGYLLYRLPERRCPECGTEF